jgi:Cellulose binding domain/Putative Ig domain
MRMRTAAASGLALTIAAAAAVVATAVPAPAAATLVVNAAQPFRPVTHVATGSLYGLAAAGVPADSLVEPLHPNTFVQMPAGGHQQPTGDILKVAPEAEKAGAKLVDRLSDYYAGWPYQFSWNTWPTAVSSQIQQVKSAGITDLAAWELWNEPDNTWLSANGTFESFWTRTFQQVRSLDAATPIQGPSFSDNISDMRNFLQNAVATNTVPDIISWHELESSSKIAGDVATVTNLEKSLGISPRPIAIEEYAAPSQVGVPGALAGYIAQFERLGVNNAELAFWNQSGALGDLLTGQGGSPNGAYWLYDWYAAMTGNMVTTTPPGGGLDGAAAVTPSQNQVSVIFGGGSGQAAVTVDGLNSLAGFSGSSQVTVTLQDTPSPGRTVAVSAPATISQSTYTVSNGSITVPVSAMNAAYGYHLTVTPVSTGGNTVTVTNPGSISGVAGQPVNGMQIHATDSAGQTLTYTATGLPAGLSISSSGLITGTPSATGTFTVKVTATDTTGASGSASFTWTISPGGGGGTCQVSYAKNEWGGGFTANLTVTNTGTSTINGWTLTWSFPGDQQVTSAWNAAVSQSGPAVRAANESYNATVAPGGSIQFGIQGTWTSNDTSPAAFALNGTACS